MGKCWYYDAKDKKNKVNCINCTHCGGKRCKDEALLIKHYEESKEFRTFDRMMRDNRGIEWL